MSDKPVFFRIEEPEKCRHKFNLSFKHIFKALGFGAAAILDGGMLTGSILIKETTRMLSEIRGDTSEECKAYILIYSAIARGAAEILRNHYKLLSDKYNPDWTESANHLFKKALDIEPIIINPTFFNNPDDLQIVKEFKRLFFVWMKESFEIREEIARDLSNQFPASFQDELIKEWTKNPANYAPIFEKVNHPFAKKEYKDALLKNYRNYLASLYHQPVMGEENIRLSDLYIEPSFYFHERCFKDGDERKIYNKILTRVGRGTPNIYLKKVGINLHKFISQWLLGNINLKLECDHANVLVLLGQPGQGKSSFCSRFLNDILSDPEFLQKQIFFTKFKDISNINDLMADPEKKLREHIIYEETKRQDLSEDQFIISKNDFSKSILVLDGLDELKMKEGLSDEKIDTLCRELGNIGKENEFFKILITSRNGYIHPENLRQDQFLFIQLGHLKPQQQIQWLNNYHSFIHKKVFSFNEQALNKINNKENHNLKGIRELVDQPILLHMVASVDLNLGDAEGEFDRAIIYDKLFTTLIERKWGGGPIDALEGLSQRQLRGFIQSIALAIFQSPNEYILKGFLLQNEFTSKFFKNTTSKVLGNSLKKIMVSFYFQEVEKEATDFQQDDFKTAIEFMHKSLQEYLAAEKIWEEIKKIGQKTFEDEWRIETSANALEIIFGLFGPKQLTNEISEYLVQIIKNDSKNDSKNEQRILYNRLLELIPYFLKQQFLPSNFATRNQSNSPLFGAIFTFHGLNFVLSHLMSRGNYLTIISPPPPVPSSYETMIRLAANIITLPQIYRAISFKSPPNFSYLNLYKVNFESAKLAGAIFSNSNLQNATLSNSEIPDAYLFEVDLTGANLEGANLDRSELSYSKLTKANLKNASLSRTNLKGAEFTALLRSFFRFQGAYLDR